MTMAGTDHPQRADEINILAAIPVLWADRWRVLAMAVAGVILGWLYLLATPPLWRADSLIQLEMKSGGGLVLSGVVEGLGDADPRAMTEIEILKSRMILGQVVEELHLDWLAAPRLVPVLGLAPQRLGLPDPGIGALARYAWGGEAIGLGALDLPEAWQGKTLVVTITAPGQFRIDLPDGGILVGSVGQMVTGAGVTIRIDRLDGAVGREFVVTQRSPLAAINALRSGLRVVERGRQSAMLEISYRATDRRRAEQVLDALARAYVAQNVSRSSAEAQTSLAFIEEQLPKAQSEMLAAQAALDTYRAAQRSVDLTFETQALLEEQTSIEAQLNDLALQEEEVKKKYTPRHPVYETILATREQLTARLAALRENAGGLPETQREVFNLSRDLEVSQQVYLQLLSRAQELRVMKASTIGNVRVIDPARTAPLPVAPRANVILSLALCGGLALGAVWAGLRRLRRRGVQGIEEIERTGLTVLASVNRAAGHERAHRGDGALPILALTQPQDLAVEGLRSLRTSLQFGMLDSTTKAVMLTSAAPESGKSFVAVNLATVAAQAGQRVCLIDADLRRGYLRRYFGLERDAAGLAELLSDQITLPEALRDTQVAGLSVIVAGRFPQAPSELLLRPALGQLIARLGEDFDLIVVDAPPILAVTDPLILARATGTSLFVARFDRTPAAEVAAAKKMFETAGLTLRGAILNGYDPARAREGARIHGYHYAYHRRE